MTICVYVYERGYGLGIVVLWLNDDLLCLQKGVSASQLSSVILL